jgi:hypothetical protein
MALTLPPRSLPEGSSLAPDAFIVKGFRRSPDFAGGTLVIGRPRRAGDDLASSGSWEWCRSVGELDPGWGGRNRSGCRCLGRPRAPWRGRAP